MTSAFLGEKWNLASKLVKLFEKEWKTKSHIQDGQSKEKKGKKKDGGFKVPARIIYMNQHEIGYFIDKASNL